MNLSEQGLMRELAGEIKGDESIPLFRRKAVVQSAVYDPATGITKCTIRLGGSTVDIPGVPVLGGYRPFVGDVVEVIRDGPQLLIIGRIGRDKWHVVGATGEPAFNSTWTPAWDCQFCRLSDGIVRVMGQAQGGSIGLVIFTLPVGYRPAQLTRFATNTYNGVEVYGCIEVSPNGDVRPIAGGITGWTSLDPVSFWAV